MLLPYHTMLKSKQTHARLGTLTSLSRIERSSPITTIFELPRGFTHPVHIDKCSEAQFKFGGPPALLNKLTVNQGRGAAI